MDNDILPTKTEPKKPEQLEELDQPDQPERRSEPVPEQDQPTEPQPTAAQLAVVAETKKSKKWLSIVLVIVLLGMLGGAYYYYTKHKVTKVTNTASVSSQTNKPIKAPVVTKPSVPTKLLQNGQSVQGVAVGYLIGKQVAVRSNPFEGQAYAAEDNYQAAVFYDSGDGQISDMNTVTKAVAKVTDVSDGATTPVFSSIDQKLAYAENKCSVAIMSVPSGTPTVVQKGSQSATCYKPLAWSPDGKYLAYEAGTETQNSSLGLVNLVKLYIYDVSLNTSTAITTPTGFNSVGAQDAYWQDPTHIAVHFVNYGFAASILSERVVLIDVTSQQSSDLPTTQNLNYQSVQMVGDTMFATSANPKQLLSGDIKANSLQPISGSDGTLTFLLQTNASNSAVDNIFTVTGNPGTENTMAINQLTPNNGKATKLYAPLGFSAYTLGFGQSYDNIIYMDLLSNSSEIHEYTISTKTDQTLVTNLPFIQS